MKGPLQTVIRNLTDKPLNYKPSCPLYVQPNGEFTLPFDPFSKWDNCSALERLLLDVRQGKALIIYLYDANYAAASTCSNVELSLNSQRILNTPVQEGMQLCKKKAEAKMEGTLPPGQLPEAPKMEREKLNKFSRVEQRVSQRAAEAAGIDTEPEEDTAKNIDKILEEHSLHRQNEPEERVQETTEPTAEAVVEVAEAEVVETPVKKGGRKKKEVVTL